MKALKICVALSAAIAICPFVAGDDDSTIRIAPKPVSPASIKVGTFFPKLKADAIDGRSFQLASATRFKATVIALTSTSCPVCKKYVPTLAAIEKEYQGKGVQFCFLNTLPSDEIADIRQVIKKHQLKGPYVHDKRDKLNESLEIRTTAEVFVFDWQRKLVYRGAVDDQYGIGYAKTKPGKNYLKDALDSVLADKPIELAATTAPGCDIWIPSKTKPVESKLTYHADIARIVQNNCVDCHREKGLAPFSLETVDDIVSHAGMIRTVVENGTMPPWFAKEENKEKSKAKWGNDRSLTDNDQANLLEWLKSARTVGNPTDGPQPKKFSSAWNIGTPDETFKIPRAFQIKANGQMPYQYTRIRTRFEKDQWIKAVEIRPTDRSVVHHVLVFVDGGGERGDRDGFFAAYVPGNTFQIFPEGFGKKIPADASLVFQIHYTPNGQATEDQMEIGFTYLNERPKHEIRVKGIANRRISIPAHASHHKEDASITIPQDIKVLAFMPHMHLRGKAFRYNIFERGQDEGEQILDIPAYDFNWQLVYRLAEPVALQKGDRIEALGWFDNSKNNPANPDPTQRVRWGDQTTEEMMLGYVEYYVSGPPSETKSTLQKLFDRYDKDGNGKVTPDEFKLKRAFERIDLNKDGSITLEELVKSRNQ